MASFEQLRKRRADDDRGAIIVLTALVILLLLFIAAFATDLGAWYRQTEEQQRAADVGSLNGISAYDRGVKDQFADLGVTTWQALSLIQQREAEERGMIEAVDTVQALLETSGLSFTTPATINVSPDPTDPSFTSTAVLIADDGSVVTIERALVETEPGVYTPVINVTVERDGEQYFSNILRDAPTIERTAQSLLSNCGATCNNPIEINPPFVGFEGTGNGDGYGPLLYDRDGDGIIDEAWAVNHHSNGSGNGQIICVDIETEDACVGYQVANGKAWELNYQTGNRPVEYLDEATGKIYYAAREGATQALGLACFDAAAKQECATPFVAFWTQTRNAAYPSWINATGPFENDGRLYVVSQDGEVACATLNMQRCTVGGPNAVAGSDTSDLPGLNNGNWVSNGEQNGDTLILTQNSNTGVLFRCIDLSRATGEVAHCGQSFNTTLGNGGDDNETFTRFDTAGNPVGVCVLNILSGNNGCVSWNGTNTGQLPGLSTDLDLIGKSWGGDTFTWDNKRTFFAGGNSNYVGCWNWEIQGACTDGPDGGGAYLLANGAFTGSVNANPYAFAQISDRCIIGLGHQAVFFSFDPEGMGPCLDLQLTTPIAPCDCADVNSGVRWGLVTLPSALLGDVTFLEATVTRTGAEGEAAIMPELDKVDLILSNGVLDLSVLNDLPGGAPAIAYLTLDADSGVDANGEPIFTDPYESNLEISVSPTLTE